MFARRPARRTWLAVAAVALFLPPLPADDSEVCVAGTVVNAVTGEPIGRTAVQLLGAKRSSALTDAGGVFRFCGMPVGRYYLRGEKPGFGEAHAYLTGDAMREGTVLRLQPHSVIKGKVADDQGEPVPNVVIQALSTTIESGRRKMFQGYEAVTNDRGEYRIAGLDGRHYFVKAAGWRGQTRLFLGNAAPEAPSKEAFALVYLGGTADLGSATPLSLEPGREARADFTVTLQSGHRIRGMIAGYDPFRDAKVELLREGGDLSTVPVSLNAATGAFQTGYVTPGSYVLRVTQGDEEQRMRGEQPVLISDSDLNGIVLTLAGGATVKGTIHSPASDAAGPPDCEVELDLVGVATSREDDYAPAIAKNEFQITGVLPGRYRLALKCGSGYPASVRAGETDLLAHNELIVVPGIDPPPIDIRLRDDGGTVDITVPVGADHQHASVVLVSDSGNALCRLATAHEGEFHLEQVAPGNYQAYAWSNSEEFEYANPQARQAWASRAVGVQVAPNGHHKIALTIPAGASR
jgi:hypothetical protein